MTYRRLTHKQETRNFYLTSFDDEWFQEEYFDIPFFCTFPPTGGRGSHYSGVRLSVRPCAFKTIVSSQRSKLLLMPKWRCLVVLLTLRAFQVERWTTILKMWLLIIVESSFWCLMKGIDIGCWQKFWFCFISYTATKNVLNH